MVSPSFFRKLMGLTLLLCIGSGLSAQRDYLQQSLRYDIKVSLDDQNHALHGYEVLHYQHVFFDTLKDFYLHLWPNAYLDSHTAFNQQKLENGSTRFHFANDTARGFIDSLDFRINGQAVNWEYWEGYPDVIRFQLAEPLSPGQSLTLETPFRVKLPDSFSRLGHVGQQYQLTQWYPKPAVYDENGWHPLYYLDMGEFFSEFAIYDVEIEVPADYVVGATGDLPPNHPEWDFLAEREKTSRALLLDEDFEGEFVETPSRQRKKLQFHQENVHDFAWFCDQNYYVLADTLNLPSGHDVRCVTMFNHRDRKYWKGSTEYVKKAVYHYSSWIGDYPYDHCTAVDGALSAGAGMEYPNITVLGAGGSKESLEEVIVHEVGHNWFYGILASNEREFPWLDEGINSYYENRYWVQEHQDSLGEAFGIPTWILPELSHSFLQRAGYQYSAGDNTDQPISTPSEDFIETNYGTIVYMKTARAFRYLEAYLGRETFDRCMQRYFDLWKFKHPYPSDIQWVFEQESGEDLNWFFGDYFAGTEKTDFRFGRMEEDKLVVKNRSGIALPVSVTLFDETNEPLETLWSEPFEQEWIFDPEIDFHHAEINAEGHFPEVYHHGNLYRRKALFKRARPLKFRFLYSYPSNKARYINYLPTVGYNTTDGFMLGVLLNSNFFPKQKFEFHFMPMFGFRNLDLAGSGGLTYRFFPKKLFRKIELHSRTSLFANLLRTHNFVEFHFANKEARNPTDNQVHLGFHHLGVRQGGEYSFPDYLKPVFGQAKFRSRRKTAFYASLLELELGGNVTSNIYRASLTTVLNQRYLKRYFMRFRLFAGGFLGTKPVPYLLRYRFSGSGDPFGQRILVDRAQRTDWLSQQILEDHGGFRTLTGISMDHWLVALNGDVQLPLRKLRFLRLFGDVGFGRRTLPPDPGMQYDAGLGLELLGGFVRFNLPVAGSAMGGLPENFQAWRQQVTFTLRFEKISNLMPF